MLQLSFISLNGHEKEAAGFDLVWMACHCVALFVLDAVVFSV